MPFNLRLADDSDVTALRQVMERAIAELQRGFLDDLQIVASRAVMGIDTQLIRDRTYFLVELGGTLAGCGGWSKRATLYGGDHSKDLREPRLLDPATEPARVRAMYTDPAFARRGVGRMVLHKCEDEARRASFASVELMATMAGEPLYRAEGYTPVEAVNNDIDGIIVPMLRMHKTLA